MAWVSPRTWTVSETLTAAKMNEISSSLNAVGDGPITYTPTIVAGWTSNVSISGKATAAGDWVDFLITVAFSGAPAGSGGVLITLPNSPSADYPTWAAIGTATIRDNSVPDQRTGATVWANLFGGQPCVSAYFGSTTRLANAAPITFASGDYLTLTGRYYRD